MKGYLRQITKETAEKILDLLKRLDMDEPYYEEDLVIYSGESEKVRPFFVAAFRSRVKRYILAVVVAIISAVVITGDQSHPVLFQVTGLCLDLLGAVILGLGLLRSEVGIERDSTAMSTNMMSGLRIMEMDRASQDKENRRDPLSVSSEARDTVDAVFGILFLIIGFALQIIAVAL